MLLDFTIHLGRARSFISALTVDRMSPQHVSVRPLHRASHQNGSIPENRPRLLGRIISLGMTVLPPGMSITVPRNHDRDPRIVIGPRKLCPDTRIDKLSPYLLTITYREPTNKPGWFRVLSFDCRPSRSVATSESGNSSHRVKIKTRACWLGPPASLLFCGSLCLG
jgi:hypothetical protein